MIKLSNGKLVPSESILPNSGNTAVGGDKNANLRGKMMQELKSRQMQKRSHNITLETIKETF